MKIVLTIFYGLVIAVVAIIKATDVIRHLMAKQYTRHLQKTKAYLTGRPAISQSITTKWAEIEPYADWLRRRIAGPSNLFGKHAQAVTDEEIDALIKDCTDFSRIVKKALRVEHKMFKKLSRSDKAAWPADEDAKWHSIHHSVRHIRVEFKALRRNLARNGVR